MWLVGGVASVGRGLRESAMILFGSFAAVFQNAGKLSVCMRAGSKHQAARASSVRTFVCHQLWKLRPRRPSPALWCRVNTYLHASIRTQRHGAATSNNKAASVCVCVCVGGGTTCHQAR